jgi:hypothetical protein
MADRIFLHLGELHALGEDDLQWILFRKRGADWRGISFVRSTKAILLRCIREADCKPVPEAFDALERLPTTFDVWKAATPSTVTLLEPIEA